MRRNFTLVSSDQKFLDKIMLSNSTVNWLTIFADSCIFMSQLTGSFGATYPFSDKAL